MFIGRFDVPSTSVRRSMSYLRDQGTDWTRRGLPDGGQSTPAVPYKQRPPGGGQTRPVADELSAPTSVSPKVKSKVRYRLADEQPLRGVAQYQFVDHLSSVLAVGHYHKALADNQSRRYQRSQSLGSLRERVATGRRRALRRRPKLKNPQLKLGVFRLFTQSLTRCTSRRLRSENGARSQRISI